MKKIKNYNEIKNLNWENLPNKKDLEQFKKDVVDYVNLFNWWVENGFIDEDTKEKVEALSIDYVEAWTFEDQEQGYNRIQWAFGGPTFEARLFENWSWENVFLDWFSWVGVNLSDNEINLLKKYFIY